LRADIGARIQKLRGGESQKAFAARAGINQSHLGKYERGEAYPRADALVKIATASGSSLDWLLTGNPATSVPASPPMPLIAQVESAIVAKLGEVQPPWARHALGSLLEAVRVLLEETPKKRKVS
jgi:transcriptional regulator with XRE-family HTH domain